MQTATSSMKLQSGGASAPCCTPEERHAMRGCSTIAAAKPAASSSARNSRRTQAKMARNARSESGRPGSAPRPTSTQPSAPST
eukprot:4445986-Lingulodinium_polyedra.AAC.1